MAWVYDHMLTQAQADHVVLVGYGHGARLCKEMLRRSLTVRPWPGLALPLFVVALLAPNASILNLTRPPIPYTPTSSSTRAWRPSRWRPSR